jgi:hypothetical protein
MNPRRVTPLWLLAVLLVAGALAFRASAAFVYETPGEFLAAAHSFSVDAQMRETVRENVQDELRQPIAEIEIVPVEPGKYGPRDEGGIRWKPNLNVVSVLKVRFTPPPPGSGLSVSDAKHTVGLQGGHYKITVPIRDQ